MGENSQNLATLRFVVHLCSVEVCPLIDTISICRDFDSSPGANPTTSEFTTSTPALYLVAYIVLGYKEIFFMFCKRTIRGSLRCKFLQRCNSRFTFIGLDPEASF
jgi:hypothetical protein